MMITMLRIELSPLCAPPAGVLIPLILLVILVRLYLSARR